MAESLRPVAAEERIHALDLLRGWAMFGVLWSNLNDHYGVRDPGNGPDRALQWIQNNLIEERFYTLLVLLFGVGFGIQLTRAIAAGRDLRNTYYRRAAALLAIGIVHGTLIWRGDILAMYALAAFALVMFRTASPRRLLVVVLLLWFFGPLLVREAMHFAGLRVMLPGNTGESVQVYVHGSWWAIEQVRVRGFLQWFGRWGLTTYAYVLAAFLLGLWTVRTGWLRRLVGEPRITRRVLLVALILGLIGYARWAWGDALWPRAQAPASYVPAFPYPYFQREMLRQSMFRLFDWSVLGSTLVYACLLLLWWQRPSGPRALRPLAATGRMALTTYLTQSVVCTLLFYSYGLGWYGNVSYTGMLLITLVLFACQMAASTWWLARHEYGPMERLWRRLTYGPAHSGAALTSTLGPTAA